MIPRLQRSLPSSISSSPLFLGLRRSLANTAPSSRIVDTATVPSRTLFSVESDAASQQLSPCYPKFHWKSMPQNILLIKKHRDRQATKALIEISSWLKKEYSFINVFIEPSAVNDVPHIPTYKHEHSSELLSKIDLVITMGGDGTILHLSAMFETDVPPVLAFSMGTLGFLMPFSVQNYKEVIQQIFSGGFSFINRKRLSCCVYDHQHNLKVNYVWNGLLKNKESDSLKREAFDSKETFDPMKGAFQVLNEVAIHRKTHARILNVNCYLNSDFLTTDMGDGLIVSSATGSTAYSMSCGGSMVHPLLDTILLTPINPRSLSFRSLVLPSFSEIKIGVCQGEGVASFDGHRSQDIKKGDSIFIRQSPHAVPTIVRPLNSDFWVRDINTLLYWNASFPNR
eukprot:TRINITY_DN2215_c0_g1_i1.p1 TRINITY_DN2215_c0_g1~~TRINITY_DN2215_c0_g1_i1.p1  ORF type:complete len:397 (+),score=43.85 TRINITY_DN2215_c0_g1_i1:43-1233(+)